MNKGERAWTIDEIPLEWCIGAGVKLDFRHLPDGHVETEADVEVELKRISYTLQPLDIVLVNTRAGEAYGGSGFLDAGCGTGRAATLYLLERWRARVRHRCLVVGRAISRDGEALC
jgi:kynurenine formamidase